MNGKKFEKTMYKILSVGYIVVFFPVLFCVFTIAMKLDYFEAMKPVTFLPNFVLFLLALPIGLLIVWLLHLGEKHPLKGKWNWITVVALVLLTVCLYFFMDCVAREIAFFLPWDIDVVRGSALDFSELRPMGYKYYFSIYSNNIPIVYVLGKILRISKEWGYSLHQEFILVQVNCALIALSILFASLTVKRLTNNFVATFLTFLAGVALIGSSGWMMVNYTDTYGQLFPILGIYLYILYKQTKSPVGKIIFLILSIGALTLGGLIKPSIYVVLIALILAELLSAIGAFEKASKDSKYEKKKILVAMIGFLAFLVFSVGMYRFSDIVKHEMMKSVGLEFNATLEAGPADYLLMGMNDEHTGAYWEHDATIFGEFQDAERTEREKIAFGRAMERIKNRGFIGNLSFFLRKMTMTFNDGTFGWATEVWKTGDYEPAVSRNLAITPYLRDFYNCYESTKKSIALNTAQHFLWIVCLIGLGACVLPNLIFGRKREMADSNVDFFLICFFGIYFYQMLFEARARYLFVFLPMLLVMSMMGYKGLLDIIKLVPFKKNLVKKK